MAGTAEESPPELVKSFQILDSIASILSMVLEGADAASVSPAIAKLQGRFQQCEALLDNLPGGDMSKDEQEQKIKSLRESIARRRQLVSKYANLGVLHQIAETTPSTAGVVSAGLPSASPNSLPGSAGTFQAAMSQAMDFTTPGSGMLSNTDHLFFGQGSGAQGGLASATPNATPGDKSADSKGLDPMEL